MPIDYASGHVRTLTASAPGVFADDPDITNPAVELPDPLTSTDPASAFAWRLPDRTTSQVKIKVTFRDGDGVEVPGTFTATGFVVVPVVAAEGDGVRPSVEKHDVVAATSAVPLEFYTLGRYDTFGLVLTGITAVDATRAFIRVEEID